MRSLKSILIVCVLLATLAAQKTNPVPSAVSPLPVTKKMNVAFVISDDFNMIDFAGPWEVFSDVMTHAGGEMKMYMTSYTVAAARKKVSSGGAVLVPQYTFANAPQADVIVIPAQTGSPELLEWLRKQNAKKTTIMSVCTGASILAQSGLIDGHSATSHHDALDFLAKKYPNVKWLPAERYVRSTTNIYTAAGLTSGIDLALHIVEVKLGRSMAQTTADYLEYRGEGWKQPNSALTEVRPDGTVDQGTSTSRIGLAGASDSGPASTRVMADHEQK